MVMFLQIIVMKNEGTGDDDLKSSGDGHGNFDLAKLLKDRDINFDDNYDDNYDNDHLLELPNQLSDGFHLLYMFPNSPVQFWFLILMTFLSIRDHHHYCQQAV